jgi:hypothetical protein
MADRPAIALSDGDILDLGSRRVRFIDTPHVPHNVDAGVIYEDEPAPFSVVICLPMAGMVRH